MKHHNKLNSEHLEQGQQHETTENHAEQQTVLEFANAEEMLRHDAQQTSVPPQIGERLEKSIEQSGPPPSRSIWRRLFGG